MGGFLSADPTSAFTALEQCKAILATLDRVQRAMVTEQLYWAEHDMLTLDDDEPGPCRYCGRDDPPGEELEGD